MEIVLEMNEANQLTIPKTMVNDLELKPGAQFIARMEGGQLTILRTPFTSREGANVLERTVDSLQNKPRRI